MQRAVGISCRALTLAVVLVSAVAGGCGSRTGLPVPEGRGDRSSHSDEGTPRSGDAGRPECEPLQIDVSHTRPVVRGPADVVFLVDTTGSMNPVVDALRERLRRDIFPAIVRAIPDARLAIARFRDFPGNHSGEELPFELLTELTDDPDTIHRGIADLIAAGGGDGAESQVEALYQLATGAGNRSYVPPASCPDGRVGYPCFRREATPIVLLFTDAPFHNGPGGSRPYDPERNRAGYLAAHTYDEAVSALRDIGARVLSFWTTSPVALDDARRDLAAISSDTAEHGDAVVYELRSSARDVERSVVRAVEAVAAPRVDVHLRAEDPDPDDDIDPRRWVQRIETLRARPPSGAAAHDGSSFQDVRGGTEVHFRVHFTTLAPTRLQLRFAFHDVERRLAERDVEVELPPLERRCPAGR